MPRILGRERDLAGVAGCFEHGARLVTLLGAGGIGKTSVASQFVAERGGEYTGHGSGGVAWCELTEAHSATAACAVVASVMRMRLDPIVDETRVVARLGMLLARRKRLLLVLDNCEHIAADVGACVRAWLTAAPHLRVLATSRVALGIADEQEWPLGPLDEASAVALFGERARQQQPSFDGDHVAITEIVNRLDRVPLAIELAAGRCRTMSPEQIRDRLQQRLDLAALRDVVLDSYRLLRDDAKICFVGCAVFHGGFTLAAAEAVLAVPGRDVWHEIDALCRQSLLRAIPSAGRFQLYEMMREVAIEMLGSDDTRALGDRHATYFVGLANALASRLAGGDDTALDELEVELENFVAAHRHGIATGSEHTYALALALDPLLAKRGLLRLRLRLLDQTLAHPGPDRIRALLARGATHRELGDLELARQDLAEARGLARQSGDARHDAVATMRLGAIAETSGDTFGAREHYQHALAAIKDAPLERSTSVIAAELHAHLGHALRRENQLEAADRELARAIELYRSARDREGIASVSYEAAVVALFRGEYAVARDWFDEGLASARAIGSRQLEAAIVTGRGLLVQEQGALDEAISAHATAVQVFRDLGNRHREASAIYYLAGAYLERGDVQQPDGLLDQALALAVAVGAPRYIALIRGLQSVAHAVRGRIELARHAADAADVAAAACASEPGLLATLRIHRAHLDHIDEAAIASARTTMATVPNDDTRFAVRLLEMRLHRVPGASSLVVAEDGMTFRAPGSERAVDLSRRAPLRRILIALARRRLESPGEALGLDELLEAGWPGERVSHEAAVNRVHVALATLRKLGLRDVLVTSDRGYLLIATVPLHHVIGAGR